MTLTERFHDLNDALVIVEKARVSIANGPRQPWTFLYRVAEHLEKARDIEFGAWWDELWTPDDEVRA